MTGRTRRGAARLVVALLLALVAGAGAVAPAGAHAQLVGSTPSDGTTVASSPAQLRIDLTQSVFPDRTTLTVTDSRGRAVAVPDLTVVATGADPTQPGLVPRAGSGGVPTTILADLPPLAPDVYRVAWRTLSTDDLHATSGVFVFGVRRAVAHRVGQVSDPLPPWGETVTRAVLALGAGVAVGAAAVLALLSGVVVPAALRRRLLLAGAAGAGAAALAGLALLLVQADVGGGLGFAESVLSSPRFLGRWLLREGAAVAAAALLLLLARRSRADGVVTRVQSRGAVAGAVVLGGASAVSAALLGHTGAGSRTVDDVAHAVHVAAATTWAGTVLVAALLLAPGAAREPLARDGALRTTVLRRFGFVGLASVTALVASGVVLTGAGTASLDALLLSTYGRLVLAKAAALLVALVAAGLLTAGLHPGLVPARWRPAARPRPRLLAVEGLVLVAALVLGVTAAGARPALGTEWVPTSVAPPILSAEPGSLVETVKVGPNAPGRNFLSANVFETRRPALGPLTGVDVVVARPGTRGTAQAMALQGDGAWVAASDAFDEPGEWTISLVAHREGLPDVRSDFDWFVPDPSARLARPLVSSSAWGGATDVVALVVLVCGLLALAAGLVVRHRRGAAAAVPAAREQTGAGRGSPPQTPARERQTTSRK